MSKYINNGQPTNTWHGITAASLIRRCEQADEQESESMSLVASLMHAGEQITEAEWSDAETALNSVEKRLVQNFTGEVKLNRYGQPHGGTHPALI